MSKSEVPPSSITFQRRLAAPLRTSQMNVHEEKFVAAFISKEKQDRYRFLLSGDSKRRDECLDRLNHCRDLNEKYVTWLPRDPRSTTRNAQIAKLLREKEGAPT